MSASSTPSGQVSLRRAERPSAPAPRLVCARSLGCASLQDAAEAQRSCWGLRGTRTNLIPRDGGGCCPARMSCCRVRSTRPLTARRATVTATVRLWGDSDTGCDGRRRGSEAADSQVLVGDRGSGRPDSEPSHEPLETATGPRHLCCCCPAALLCCGGRVLAAATSAYSLLQAAGTHGHGSG